MDNIVHSCKEPAIWLVSGNEYIKCKFAFVYHGYNFQTLKIVLHFRLQKCYNSTVNSYKNSTSILYLNSLTVIYLVCFLFAIYKSVD